MFFLSFEFNLRNFNFKKEKDKFLNIKSGISELVDSIIRALKISTFDKFSIANS